MAGDARQQATSPRVKTFTCSACGGSVAIRAPGRSLVAVCSSCSSLIDVRDDTYRILVKHQEKASMTPLIPLGQRGTLQGELWEVIGFLQRRQQDSFYTWQEYLLFNPRQGYRWLVQASGHWNFVTVIKERPTLHEDWRSRTTARLFGTKYALFDTGTAQVTYVLGEFYWRVKVGETVQTADYIAPPEMLSCEQSRQEITWSFARYLPADHVQTAFDLDSDRMPFPEGIAPNQPSAAGASFPAILKTWTVFVVLIGLIQLTHMGFSGGKVAYQRQYRLFSPHAFSGPSVHKPHRINRPSSHHRRHARQTFLHHAFPVSRSGGVMANRFPKFTSPPFALSGQMANVDLVISAPVNNSWVFVEGELVQEKTGIAYPFEQTVEYYHGVDGGERWSEGSSTQHVLLSSIPQGQYHLNLSVQQGATAFTGHPVSTLDIQVKRNVPTTANFWWTLLFLSLIPLWAWWDKAQFEAQRWSGSTSSGGTDDDSD